MDGSSAWLCSLAPKGFVRAMADHPKKRIVSLRLSRQSQDERAFDDAFWRELGPAARLEALWDMVLEAELWQGRSGDQPRLQRSLLRIERR